MQDMLCGFMVKQLSAFFSPWVGSELSGNGGKGCQAVSAEKRTQSMAPVATKAGEEIDVKV
jgi:hypothetical protein